MYGSQAQQTYVNGFLNGSVVDLSHTAISQQVQVHHQQQTGAVPTNLIAVSNIAPINPGSIPSVGPLGNSSNANRTSIGGGISPINFSNSPVNVITGGTNHYPVSSQFMIGDYVMPGTVLVQQQQAQNVFDKKVSLS